MKQLMTLLITILTPLFALGQAAAPSYSMYETMYMTSKDGVTAQLNEKMGAHNRKYHAKAPNEARVWTVVNGRNTGKLVWVFGPTTFTDMDARPDKGEHNDDWDKNVQPLLASVQNVEYWELNPDYSFFPNKTMKLSKMRVRFINIKPGENAHWNDLRKKITAAYATGKMNRTIGYYESQFANTKSGWQIAVVTFFDKWAAMDEDIMMSKVFDELHGSGAWSQWQRDWNDIVVAYEDEVRQIIPEMSGNSDTVVIPGKQ